MKRTTISLPDELWQDLEREAKLRRLSVSALVRSALEQELKKAPPGFIAMFSSDKMTAGAEIHRVLESDLADALSRDR